MLSDLTIHMGMPKTGTKSLQKALSAAREKLSAAGILYPSEFCNASGLAHHPLAIELHQSASSNLPLVDAFVRFLETRTEPGILISSESFTNCLGQGALPRLATFLREAALSRRVHLVIALRRMDSFVESMYLQAIKAGEYRADFRSWLRGREEWTRELFGGISRLKQSPAVETFDVVCYHPEAIESDILPALGLADQKGTIGPIPRSNTRLGLKGHAFLRYMAEFESERNFRFDRWFIIRSLESGKFSFADDEVDYSVYDPGQQMSVHDESLRAAREAGLDEYIRYFADDVPRPRPRFDLAMSLVSEEDISAIMEFQREFRPKWPQRASRKHPRSLKAGAPG